MGDLLQNTIRGLEKLIAIKEKKIKKLRNIPCGNAEQIRQIEFCRREISGLRTVLNLYRAKTIDKMFID